MDVLKNESSEKQDKYIEEIVDLEKKKKAFDNIVYKTGQTVQTMHMLTKPQVFYDNTYKTALGYQNSLYLLKSQRLQPVLYSGSALAKKHDAISVIDTEETLRGAFEKDVIPFVKSLKESFKNFKLGLYRKVYEMKAIFQQMETEVDQCFVDRKYFEIEKKELLIENDRLLEQIIFQDIMCTAMHSYYDLVKYADMENSFIEEYNKCLELEAELFKKKYMVEKEDETPEFIIKFLKQVQVRLNATVRKIRTDNGTKFVNQTLKRYYKDVGITHQTSVARTPQQNDIVERRNQTLVEAARTMLIFLKHHYSCGQKQWQPLVKPKTDP
ncbi:retrovirus-related pol polyprotein from transposon TNT 1-94 [Tanacetum coccineum]|uniref:Retrovirus-related pol polyprotein from transposon TNT 1-94 n=1 Tax=Tanacetum coccineum TaxID=301880 RepID=A0ABQ5JCQ1_9ASTR